MMDLETKHALLVIHHKEHHADEECFQINKRLLKACIRAEQTIRNISFNLEYGDMRTIAGNEADNLERDIAAAKGGDE